MKNYAIILASGTGERLGLDVPKQFVKIAGKTVFEHTVQIFEKHKNIDEIIVVTNKNNIEIVETFIEKNNYKKIKKILVGGKSRRESSFIGISSIKDEDAKVLIHDAVRPFISLKIIDDCLEALKTYNAVDVAITSADTIIKVNDKNIIEDIPDRKYLKRGQTPQAFNLKTIKKAHELANKKQGIVVTDDCGLILKFNLTEVYVVEGDDYNMKITYPIDIAIADKLFQLKTSKSLHNELSEIKNKVLVIFGASKGIGKSIYDLAVENNAKTYGYSRSNGVDVTDFEQVNKVLNEVLKKEGKIDYIINTAGLLKIGNLNSKEISDIKNEVEINYMGCINVAKASFEHLQNSKGSLLFFTSSSYTRGRSLYSIYSSTKAAIVNLAQALAEEWENDNIRINVINPERTDTPMRFENFGNEPKNSLLKPEQVAEISLNVLLSDYSGQIIDINKDFN